MSDPLTQEQIDQIAGALMAGRKIEAIKIYRNATGQGLKEAKDFVEALIPRLKEQDPEKYAVLGEATKGGCGAAILLWLGLAAVGWTWLGG